MPRFTRNTRGLRDPAAVCSAQGNVDVSNAPAASDPVWDNASPQVGEVVMLARQSDATESAPWVYNGEGEALTRAPFFRTSSQVRDGFKVEIDEGLQEGDRTFRLTTNRPVGGYDLGTTSLAWARTDLGGGEAGGGWSHYQSFVIVEGQTNYVFAGATWPAPAQASKDAWRSLIQWGGLLLVPVTDYTISSDRIVLTSPPTAEEAAGGEPLAARIARAV